MSDVLDRLRPPTTRSTSTRLDPVASIWVRGVFAATWSVAVGLAALVVLSLVVWAADSKSVASAGGAMRFAAQLWLLAQRTPLRIDGGSLTIPPLGLTLIVGGLLARATMLVARTTECRDARDIGTIVGSVVAPYAVLATLLAFLTPSATLRPSVGAAFVCALIVGGVSATIGALRGAGLTRAGWTSLSLGTRTAVEAAAASAAVLAGAATVLTVASLISHRRDIGSIAGSFHTAPGEFAMLLISLLLLPNAVIFGLAYIVGPGFAVGSGTSVTLGGVHAGAVPALPLLAAVPSGRPGAAVIALCVAAVIAAGAAAGWRITRRAGGDGSASLSVRDQVRSAAIAGVGLGVAAAALCGFAGGPSGPGRLSAVGPSPWQVGLVVAGEVSVAATVVVMVSAWLALARGKVSPRR